MTLLTNGQTVSGTFDSAVHNVVIHTYTFQARANDNIVLRATARGYNSAQLSVRVTGPAPGTNVIANQIGRVHLTVPQTGVYTVELIY